MPRNERRLWEATPKDDTNGHVIIENIGKIDKQFRTTVETYLDSYFNELIIFTEPFSIIIVRDKNGFYLQDNNMNFISYLSITTKETDI